MKVIHKFVIENIHPNGELMKLEKSFPAKSKNCNVTYNINAHRNLDIILHEEIDLITEPSAGPLMKYEMNVVKFLLVPTGVPFSVTPEYDRWLKYQKEEYPNIPIFYFKSLSNEYVFVKTIHITEYNEFYHLYKHVYNFNANHLR